MGLLDRKQRLPIQGKTVFAAHRGYSSAAPENTMAAFYAAADAGFGAIECDVWETGGREPALMISHDESLRRMCGADLLITELSPEEIRRHPVIRGNGIKEYGNTLRIPFYEEYLQVISKKQLIPIVEIKAGKTENSRMSDQGVKKLMEMLYKAAPEKAAVIQSFDLSSLMKAAVWARQGTELFLLTKAKKDLQANALQEYKRMGLTGISLKKTLASSKALAQIKGCGLKIAVWTADSVTQALGLWKTGNVDYLISNTKVFF